MMRLRMANACESGPSCCPPSYKKAVPENTYDVWQVTTEAQPATIC